VNSIGASAVKQPKRFRCAFSSFPTLAVGDPMLSECLGGNIEHARERRLLLALLRVGSATRYSRERPRGYHFVQRRASPTPHGQRRSK
jgi:hypothetical protein